MGRYEISIVDISTLLKNIDIDIDIDMAILKNIDIDIDIDKVIPKISISISISIRQFCKISISIKYRIDSNLAYRTGLDSLINKDEAISSSKEAFLLCIFLVGNPTSDTIMHCFLSNFCTLTPQTMNDLT